jgi:hypothetical protein
VAAEKQKIDEPVPARVVVIDVDCDAVIDLGIH